MNRQRIKAFTILEVTITMLLAAIVIGITYTTYSIIVKSYGAFKMKNDDLAVIIRVDQLLKRDFNKGDFIIKTAKGIIIKNKLQTVDYDFEPEYLVRTAGIVDTFKVTIQDLSILFENQPLNELSDTEEHNRLDEMSFNLIYKDEKIPYHYQKAYSSFNLIKRNPNAIN